MRDVTSSRGGDPKVPVEVLETLYNCCRYIMLKDIAFYPFPASRIIPVYVFGCLVLQQVLRRLDAAS